MFSVKKITGSLFLVSFLLASFPSSARAALSACSVSVNPQTVSGGSSSSLVVSVTNNDVEGNALHWVKVIAPTNDFTITSADGPSLGGVAINESGSEVAINTSLSVGEMGEFPIGITTGNNGVSAASFTIQASDTSEGSDPVTCTGDSAVTVTANTQAILSISNVKVSASESAATITWSSGGTATGLVDYGTSTDYGSQSSDLTQSTSHSVTLTGLSSSTTYHFRITNSDQNQNSTQSSDSTFVTGSPGATVTVTTVTTTTTIKTVIQEIKDTTPPQVTISTDLTAVFKVAPRITGTATDEGGIASVSYSTDGGRNWQAIDINEHLGKRKVVFQFVPPLPDDGNYKILVRTQDPTGNMAQTKEQILIIDRLAPQVGAVLFSLGPILVKPDANGDIHTVVGLNNRITLSSIGGATSIDLLVGTRTYPLSKNMETGLWSSLVSFSEEGEYRLQATLIDGANNKTVKDLHKIIIEHAGTVTSETKQTSTVTVYTFDTDSQQFVVWNSEPFNQTNPQQTGDNGTYSLFLPSGKYYLEVTSLGYKKARSQIFDITTPTAITKDIVLQKASYSLVEKILSIIGLSPVTEVKIDGTAIHYLQKESDLVNTEIPNYEFASQFRGKPTVISFVSTWLPGIVEQIQELSEAQADTPEVRFVVVGALESKTKFDIFMRRGEYKLTYFSDADGEIVTPLSLETMPTHLFLDRKGIIKNTFVGIINKGEIKERLIY